MSNLKIIVGTSKEDTLCITLPDSIKYSNTFLTDPFGSNRMLQIFRTDHSS